MDVPVDSVRGEANWCFPRGEEGPFKGRPIGRASSGFMVNENRMTIQSARVAV